MDTEEVLWTLLENGEGGGSGEGGFTFAQEKESSHKLLVEKKAGITLATERKKKGSGCQE